MKITKVKVKNMYGIKEFEMGSENLELAGKNGAGKSSLLDAIRFGLTNKSTREYVVRNGETEGEIIIETGDGLRINRKARTNQADYKSVKRNGAEVPSPENFLREIFNPLQLSPIEFLAMHKNEQNAIILSMIDYKWGMDNIREWFGEVPYWVSYNQNILAVLNDIQSEKGQYFLRRQDINRDIRNKRAFVEEIAAVLPPEYSAERWENENIGDLYRQIEKIRKENEVIEKAKAVIENRENKMRSYEAEKEISISAIDREISGQRTRLSEQIAKLEEQILSCKKELAGLTEKAENKIKVVEEQYKANIAKYDAEYAQYEPYANCKPKDTRELEERAEYVEEMKGHINEYNRMMALEEEIEAMKEESEALTQKIQKARELPGEILREANIPIKGLSVKDGIPLINGLPISNLSDGEKLDLCIDVALQKPDALQIILVDGVEKLSTAMREQLYAKCREKGLQFISTRTTDDDTLTIYHL